MRRYLLALAALSVSAFGQENTLQPSSPLDAYRAKALENALRTHVSPQGFRLRFQTLGDRAGLTPRILRLETAPAALETGTCAIPLTTIPANPAIDPHISHPLKRESLARDKMPTANAMPVCRR